MENVDLTQQVGLSRPLQIERGIHGIALDRRSGIAFLPGEVLGRGLVGGAGAIRLGDIGRYLYGRDRIENARFGRIIRSRALAAYRLFTTRNGQYPCIST